MDRLATLLLSLGSLLVACSGQLTDLEKAQVLDVHNALRGEVQPQAANMKKLKYDESLGELAQKHASECRWAPNTVARAQFPTTGLGENLAFRFGSEVNSDLQVTRFVHEWYAESAFFEYDTGLCAAKETCSHYMQLVSGDAASVGCGIFECKTFIFLGMTLSNATFFVCHYTPGGITTPGTQPYIEGQSCSECSADYPACERNLCALSASASSPIGTTLPPNVQAGAVTDQLLHSATPTDNIQIEVTSESPFVQPDAPTTAPLVDAATGQDIFTSSQVVTENLTPTVEAIQTEQATTENTVLFTTQAFEATTAEATTESATTAAAITESATTAAAITESATTAAATFESATTDAANTESPASAAATTANAFPTMPPVTDNRSGATQFPPWTFPNLGNAQVQDPVTDTSVVNPTDTLVVKPTDTLVVKPTDTLVAKPANPSLEVASLLPAKCLAPVGQDIQECWGEAWLIWSRKYSQWTAGQCVGQVGKPLM